MKPRMCKVKHNPPEQYGDCIAACISSIADHDVPHVYNGGSAENAWQEIRKSLKTIGKSVLIFPIETDPHDFMKETNEDIYYMLIGRTERGEDHAVVCLNGEVKHDPAWYRSKMVRPHSCGLWLIGVIVDV